MNVMTVCNRLTRYVGLAGQSEHIDGRKNPLRYPILDRKRPFLTTLHKPGKCGSQHLSGVLAIQNGIDFGHLNGR